MNLRTEPLKITFTLSPIALKVERRFDDGEVFPFFRMFCRLLSKRVTIRASVGIRVWLLEVPRVVLYWRPLDCDIQFSMEIDEPAMRQP